MKNKSIKIVVSALLFGVSLARPAERQEQSFIERYRQNPSLAVEDVKNWWNSLSPMQKNVAFTATTTSAAAGIAGIFKTLINKLYSQEQARQPNVPPISSVPGAGGDISPNVFKGLSLTKKPDEKPFGHKPSAPGLYDEQISLPTLSESSSSSSHRAQPNQQKDMGRKRPKVQSIVTVSQEPSLHDRTTSLTLTLNTSVQDYETLDNAAREIQESLASQGIRGAAIVHIAIRANLNQVNPAFFDMIHTLFTNLTSIEVDEGGDEDVIISLSQSELANSLTSLELNNIMPNARGIFNKFKNLREITLWELTDEQFRKIAESEVATQLTSITLIDGTVSPEVLGEFLNKFSNLNTLNLMNVIDDEGFKAIAHSSIASQLESLALSTNSITNQGVTSELLNRFSHLNYLYINYNDIGQAGYDAIQEANLPYLNQLVLEEIGIPVTEAMINDVLARNRETRRSFAEISIR